MAVMDITGNRLYWQQDTEKILIEPWGKDGLRVRVTRNGSFDGKDWALENPHTVPQAKAEIYETAPPNFAQDAARLGQGEYQFNEKPEKKPNAMRIVNGSIVGAVSIEWRDEEVERFDCWSKENEPAAYLSRVAVSRSAQGKGLAQCDGREESTGHKDSALSGRSGK